LIGIILKDVLHQLHFSMAILPVLCKKKPFDVRWYASYYFRRKSYLKSHIQSTYSILITPVISTNMEKSKK